MVQRSLNGMHIILDGGKFLTHTQTHFLDEKTFLKRNKLLERNNCFRKKQIASKKKMNKMTETLTGHTCELNKEIWEERNENTWTIWRRVY